MEKALAQQKTEYQSLLKKQKNEFQAQMVQQSIAQKAQVSDSQTVKPIRQPKGPPAFTKLEEGMRDYHISEYLKNLGFLSKKEIDSNYPVKPFQRPRPQRSNVSTRIDRVEEGINETRESVNQLTEEFQKLNIRKPVVRSNFNRSYFTPVMENDQVILLFLDDLGHKVI